MTLFIFIYLNICAYKNSFLLWWYIKQILTKYFRNIAIEYQTMRDWHWVDILKQSIIVAAVPLSNQIEKRLKINKSWLHLFLPLEQNLTRWSKMNYSINYTINIFHVVYSVWQTYFWNINKLSAYMIITNRSNKQ